MTSNADRAFKKQKLSVVGAVINMITMKATMTRMPTMTMMIIKIAKKTMITIIKIKTMIRKMKDYRDDD